MVEPVVRGRPSSPARCPSSRARHARRRARGRRTRRARRRSRPASGVKSWPTPNIRTSLPSARSCLIFGIAISRGRDPRRPIGPISRLPVVEPTRPIGDNQGPCDPSRLSEIHAHERADRRLPRRRLDRRAGARRRGRVVVVNGATTSRTWSRIWPTPTRSSCFTTSSGWATRPSPGPRDVGPWSGPGWGTTTSTCAAAGRRGIAVCNVPDYGTEEVADHSIMLLLAVARHLRDPGRLDEGRRPGTT